MWQEQGVCHALSDCRFEASRPARITAQQWELQKSRATGSSGIGFHPDARADRIAVAINVVDAADGGPELVLFEPGRREGGLFPGVGMVPVFGGDHVRGMRGVFERVVLFV